MKDLFFLDAKCVNTNKDFYIRFDKAAGGRWCQTYGVKSKPVDSTGGSFQSMKIDISKADIGPQYQCPHCGNENYVRCSSCGKLTCHPRNEKHFKCSHCGHEGTVGGYITDIDGNSGTGQG